MVAENHLIVDLRIDNTRICSKTKENILTTVGQPPQPPTVTVCKAGEKGRQADMVLKRAMDFRSHMTSYKHIHNVFSNVKTQDQHA